MSDAVEGTGTGDGAGDVTEPKTETGTESKKIEQGNIQWKTDGGLQLSADGGKNWIVYKGDKGEVAVKLKEQIIKAPIENKSGDDGSGEGDGAAGTGEGEENGEDKNKPTWQDTAAFTIKDLKKMTAEEIRNINIDQLKALKLTEKQIREINTDWKEGSDKKAKIEALIEKMQQIPEAESGINDSTLRQIKVTKHGGTKKRRNKNRRHTRKNKNRL